ncbi:30S ribosomal protein S8 [Chloroflexota bacterium]
MVNDPIADMLTRIRNALMVKHTTVLVPASSVKLAIARIMRDEGYCEDYEVLKGTPQRVIKVNLRYGDKKQPVINGIKRISKPSRRIYVKRAEIPRVYSGLGVAVLSTPRGIMTGKEARRSNVGGELLCYIW